MENGDSSSRPKRIPTRITAANAVTTSRMIFAGLILFVPAFSAPFYVFYLLGAATDMADGAMARALHQQTPFGAKLDTAADLVFVFAVLIKILANETFPRWLWIWTSVVAGNKGINLISGFVVCHEFVSVHSIMNKITGIILFFLPLIIGLDLPQQTFSGVCIITCAVATLAAVQEGHYIRTGKVAD